MPAINGDQMNGHGANKIVRVGLIGCGEIAQVSHIAAFGNLNDHFRITYLCDISDDALEHCANKVSGARPQTTHSAAELCQSADVDAVVIANATALHTRHAILALENNKHVLVEKPLALCTRDIQALKAAEDASSGKVFVGYMRRYAPGFSLALKEIGDKSQIQYVRVRDIIGGNNLFVPQSGTFPRKFTDYNKEDSQDLDQLNDDIMTAALSDDCGVPKNAATMQMLHLLYGLGSHDLSAMREAIGMPRKVLAADLRFPVWSAMLDYGHFTAVYESGINDVPDFDAHIEVYTAQKVVRIEYDTPYIRGLPVLVKIKESIEGIPGALQERQIRYTYEDTYTTEFLKWYEHIIKGAQIKTSIEDAGQDVELNKMLMQAAFGQKS